MTIAFARGVPAPDFLLADDLRAAADTVLRRDPARILSYGTGGGYPPLRELLGERHGVDASRIVVTSGSLQGFELLAGLLLERARAERPGVAPTVLVERPTYDRPLLQLRRLGARIVSVDLDEHGLDVDAFAEVAEREQPVFAYVIPSFQNPGGATLDEQRRARLVELSASLGLPVLEDDPYGLLHVDDEPAPPTLFERRGDAPIIYSSSFSKTVSPGLRVGYLVLPADLAPLLEQRANDTYISATLLGQAIVDETLRNGVFERSVERARELLRLRRDTMCDAIDELLPGASYVRPAGGYFLWLRLPDGVGADALAAACKPLDVTFVAGNAFGEDLDDHIRLAYSSTPVDDLRTGIERIAEGAASLAGVGTR
jgi:DNA-binding transcriptional MocR family regulator